MLDSTCACAGCAGRLILDQIMLAIITRLKFDIRVTSYVLENMVCIQNVYYTIAVGIGNIVNQFHWLAINVKQNGRSISDINDSVSVNITRNSCVGVNCIRQNNC